MKRMFDIALVGVVVLDAIVIAYRLVGGRQGQLMHVGLVALPLYIPLVMAWVWLLVVIPDVIKGRLRHDWKRILALAVLSTVPLFV